MQIQRHDSPDPALRTALLARLDAHNDAGTGRVDPGHFFTIPLRRPDGALEGGLIGYAWYGWLVVEMLYLPPALRGHDLGTRLMREAEGLAVRLGCHGIWLSTLSFQAPGFYERLGFSRFAALADRPAGHATVFLAKTGLAPCAPGLPIEGRATPADRAVISDGLRAEVDAIAPFASFPLAFTAGDALGGLWVVLARDWMFLDLFVLPPALRRAGAGRAILAQAEQAARAHGCVGIWLDTFSFQARPFYEKLGYTVFGTLANYPPGHTRYFLSKRLDAGGGAAEPRSSGSQGG